MNNHLFNIIEVFLARVEETAHVPALVHEGRSVTYKDLLNDVLCTAAYYQQKGIIKGDKVLVSIPVSIDLYRTILAILYLGAIPVLPDEWLSGDLLKEGLDKVPCSALIAPGKLILYTSFNGPLRSIPLKIKSGKMNAAPASSPPYQGTDNEVAVVCFTARENAVKVSDLSHELILAQLTALKPLLQPAQDITLTTFAYVPLWQLALGKTTVLPPDKFKAGKPDAATIIANACKENKVTTLIIPPVLMDMLTTFSLPLVRHIYTGGDPVFPSLAGDITIKFPQAATTIIYGITPALPISHITSAEVGNTSLKTLKSRGLPVGFTDGAIAASIIPFHHSPIPPLSSFAWQQLQCKPGEAGEIVVSGEHVLKQYLHDTDAASLDTIHVDGVTWLRTGDAGSVSEEGKLYYLGHMQELFEWDGQLIFPTIAANSFKMRSGASEAALVMHKDKLVLVIEAAAPLNDRMLSGSLQDTGLTSATVKYLKKIPKEPHQPVNIDYKKLISLL